MHEIARGTSKTGTKWRLCVDADSSNKYWLHCYLADGSCHATRRFDVVKNKFLIVEDRDRHVMRRVLLWLSTGRG